MKTFLPLKRDKIVRAPWGYSVDPNDPYLLLPVVDHLKVLEEGKDMLDKGASLRRVADYISAKTGAKISQTSVRTYYYRDPDRAEQVKHRDELLENYTKNNINKKYKKLPTELREKRNIGRLKTKITNKEKKLIRLREERREADEKLKEYLKPVEAPRLTVAAEAAAPNQTQIIPNPGPQTEFLAAPEFDVLYGGAAGGGKELSLNTEIPTPYGIVTMGEIKVGDYVFRDNGEPVEVIWKSEVDYTPDSYEIEFDTGEVIQCDARHLWKTLTDLDRTKNLKSSPEWRAARRASRPSRAKKESAKPWVSKTVTALNKERVHECKEIAPSVRTTKEIFDTQFFRGHRSNHSVNVMGSLDLPDRELLVPPYLLGAWLGDGHSASSAIGMADEDISELEPHFNWETSNKYKVVRGTNKPFTTYTFKGLITVLRKYGLRNNKHIPMEYLRSSTEQRKELLCGLMDTDGTVDKDGKVSIMFSNKTLVEDTLQLICSLGIKARITTKEAKIGDKSYGTAYRICFNPTFPVFKLQRKLARQVTASRPTNFVRYIVAVRKCDPVPMQCIQVNHPDGMYCVTRSFIPTHNSFALLVDPLRTVHLPAHKAIIFRKTNDDLRTLIGMSKELYGKLIPGAKYNEQKSTWYFPAGGWMWFRYLDKDADVESMQGQDFSWAGFDELTQWSTPFVYNYVRSRIRTTSKEIEPYLGIRCTANPGGVGGHWVKKLYIDPSPPNTPFIATDYETGEPMYWPANHQDPKRRGQPLFYRKFIPAKLQDNPYLYNTGSYEAGLLSLPEVQRRQLLDGDWDVAEGAAFTEFSRRVHTCAPFDIPSHWMRFRAADWGYTQPGCVLWFAIDPSGTLYCYREYYHRRVLAPDVADKVLEIEQGEDIRYGIMDVSAWNQRGSGDTGPSIAETMIKRGCFWRPSDRHKFSRKFGKMEIHRRLQVKLLPDEINGKLVEKPSLVIFNTCLNLIRTLPVIPTDNSNPEDVDTDSEDHAYDALRYGCMSRPINPNARVYRPHISAVAQSPQYNSFGFPI